MVVLFYGASALGYRPIPPKRNAFDASRKTSFAVRARPQKNGH